MARGMRDLRRTLATIVLSAPLFGCVEKQIPGTPCPTQHDDTFVLDGADPTLTSLIAQCEQQDSCEALCTELDARKYGDDGTAVRVCELVPAEGGGDAVHVAAGFVCGGRRPGNYRQGVAPGTCDAVAAYFALLVVFVAVSVCVFVVLFAVLV